MAKNRLKTMRKVSKKTQAEIASFIGVSQNAYWYWENGKVKIDNESLTRLAQYYGVSLDFLSGRLYRLSIPVEDWDEEIRLKYEAADDYMKEYLEYCYGGIMYIDSSAASVNIQNSVIGDYNSDCCNAQRMDGLEEMLLHFFRKLSVEDKYSVLEFTKKKSNREE